MILLSFGSALKYIISLMLAVLGYIPFEEVQSISQTPEQKEFVYSEFDTPKIDLSFLEQLSTEELKFESPVFAEGNPVSTIIERNDFELINNWENETQCYYEFVVEEFNYEIESEKKQILILYKKNDIHISGDNVLFIHSNI